MDDIQSRFGDNRNGASSSRNGVIEPPSTTPPAPTQAANATALGDTLVDLEHQAALDKLAKERNRILDRWADVDTLGLTAEEAALNAYQRLHCFKFLFGEMGFNPPVAARNSVSVSMHNPRFSAALWAVNSEAYRRKGSVSSAAVQQQK